MRLSNLFVAATIILILALLGMWRWNTNLDAEKKRLLANQSAFIEKEKEYILRDSLNAAYIEVITLKTS